MRRKECTVKNGLNKKCKRKAVKIILNDCNNKEDYMCAKCYKGFNNSFFVGSFGSINLTIKDI